MNIKKLDLTDSEWMEIIDGDRDGLPRCCANISALRDSFITVARNGGEVTFFSQLERHMSWCFPDHDMPDLMQKVAGQLGWRSTSDEHPRDNIEL